MTGSELIGEIIRVRLFNTLNCRRIGLVKLLLIFSVSLVGMVGSSWSKIDADEIMRSLSSLSKVIDASVQNVVYLL